MFRRWPPFVPPSLPPTGRIRLRPGPFALGVQLNAMPLHHMDPTFLLHWLHKRAAVSERHLRRYAGVV